MMTITTYSKYIKSMIRFLILLVVLFNFLGFEVQAQQDAQYTQYMYNTVSVNPGYAGSRGHISIAALHRSQWIGLEGAPKTQTLNIHSPIGGNGMGMGISLVNDVIGPTSETYFDIDMSYTLKTSQEGKLSFGIKGSAHLLDIRFSELNIYAPDATLEQDIDNKFSPNFGAGVYYHTNKYYLGLSVPRFLQTSHFEESSVSTAREQMNFYFITGYVFDVNNNLKFKPTVLTKIVQGAPLQVDLSANFLLNDKFILGAGYRWDAALSAMVGFQLNESLLLGMAYDKEVTELGSAAFNDGSFEIIFRYDFIKSKGNVKSPRFF